MVDAVAASDGSMERNEVPGNDLMEVGDTLCPPTGLELLKEVDVFAPTPLIDRLGLDWFIEDAEPGDRGPNLPVVG